MITNCLTYNQLQAYSTHTVQKAERERLYLHISSCELCACAVNGFAALPFTPDELVAIHREIDVKANATAAHSLTFAQVFIMIISLISIAGVYLISDHQPAKNSFGGNPAAATPAALIPVKNETQAPSPQEIPAAVKTPEKIEIVTTSAPAARNITPIERLEMIAPPRVSANTALSENEEVIATQYNANIIYIYDLKVSDYNKLYFNHSTDAAALFQTHTSAFRENKQSKTDDFGPEVHSIPADRILKEGLAAFNKQDFSKAMENFNLLLENNPKDVNARFYAALSCYNMNKVSKAMEELNAVLQNSNQSFYPEAQWYLALVTLKTNDLEKARVLLQTIISEKGFYAKKAKEKLKGL